MHVDVHRDLRAVVPGKLLHHLGVHAVDGEQAEVGVAELVQAPVVEPVLLRSSVHQRERLVGRIRVPQLSVITALSSVCSM